MTAVEDVVCAEVPSNRWDLLRVPDIGAWEPTERVTVVIPYYRQPDELPRTLAALAGQTYPSSLLEVVVADDGSDPPCAQQDVEGLNVRVVAQPRDGFGLARARNTGARAGTGSILIFLDSDMVPERDHVEAHARWHHATSDAVVIGFRRHVDFDLEPGGVREAMSAATLESHFDGRLQQVPEYIEGHMTRTSNLTSADDDLFRVVTGGNVSVRRNFYEQVGGFDESFRQWGAEDTEFGYRAFTAGAVIVPERRALCFHQGLWDDGPDPQEAISLEQQRARLSHLIAHHGFRRSVTGRSFVIPRVGVSIDARGLDRDAVQASAENLLASTFHDLVVELRVDETHADAEWVRRQFGQDPRVMIVEDDDASALSAAVPLLLTVPPAARLASNAVGQMVQRMLKRDDPLGALRLTVSGLDPKQGIVVMRSTRALGRATRVSVTTGGDVDALIGSLFGERWEPGTSFGVTTEKASKNQKPTPRPRASAGNAQQIPEDVAALVQLADGVSANQRVVALKIARRLVQLGASGRALAGARTAAEGKRAAAEVAKAILPWRAQVSLRQRRAR